MKRIYERVSILTLEGEHLVEQMIDNGWRVVNIDRFNNYALLVRGQR